MAEYIIDDKKEKQSFCNIKELEKELKSNFYIKDLSFSLIRLVFLKYVVDNCIGSENKDDLMYYSMLRNQISRVAVGGGPNLLHPVFMCLEKKFNLKFTKKEKDQYIRLLFNLDEELLPISYSYEGSEKLMKSLSKCNLEEIGSINEKGKELALYLLGVMNTRSSGYRNTSNPSLREEAVEIAKEVLDVKDGDTLLDFAAGGGSEIISIANGKDCNIVAYDSIEERCNTMTMLFIMMGYNNYNVKCKNEMSYSDSAEKADKIFTDVLKMEKLNYKSESSSIVINKTWQTLKDDGLAVVNLHSNFLFNETKYSIDYKKLLMNRKCVRAVVSLPINTYGSGSNIHLMVLTKNCLRNSILFVNGKTEAFSQYVVKEKNTTITNEGISLISNIIKECREIEGLSRIVDYEEIEKNNFNLLPNAYVSDGIKEEDISIEEIDWQLEKLYDELNKI